MWTFLIIHSSEGNLNCFSASLFLDCMLQNNHLSVSVLSVCLRAAHSLLTVPWLTGFQESVRGQCCLEFGTLLHSGSNPPVTVLFRTIASAADFRSSVAVHLFIVMLHLPPGYVIVYHYDFCLQLRAETDYFAMHGTI